MPCANLKDIKTITMQPVKDLFNPRHTESSSSEKLSTIGTKDRELQRVGVDAAIRKVNNKWRQRLRRAMDRLRRSSEYQTLERYRPERCERYLDDLQTQFNKLKETELCLVHELADHLDMAPSHASAPKRDQPLMALRTLLPKPLFTTDTFIHERSNLPPKHSPS